MKKNYFLIIGLLILLTIGSYLALQNFSSIRIEKTPEKDFQFKNNNLERKKRNTYSTLNPYDNIEHDEAISLLLKQSPSLKEISNNISILKDSQLLEEKEYNLMVYNLKYFLSEGDLIYRITTVDIIINEEKQDSFEYYGGVNYPVVDIKNQFVGFTTGDAPSEGNFSAKSDFKFVLFDLSSNKVIKEFKKDIKYSLGAPFKSDSMIVMTWKKLSNKESYYLVFNPNNNTVYTKNIDWGTRIQLKKITSKGFEFASKKIYYDKDFKAIQL